MINLSGFKRIISLLDSDINYLGIGTGVEPTAGSLTLNLEAQRKLSTALEDEETLVEEGFWDINEANGSTYLNAGIFCNGANSVLGTGQLFCGGAINATKDNTQTLTLSFEVQLKEAI